MKDRQSLTGLTGWSRHLHVNTEYSFVIGTLDSLKTSAWARYDPRISVAISWLTFALYFCYAPSLAVAVLKRCCSMQGTWEFFMTSMWQQADFTWKFSDNFTWEVRHACFTLSWSLGCTKKGEVFSSISQVGNSQEFCKNFTRSWFMEVPWFLSFPSIHQNN